MIPNVVDRKVGFYGMSIATSLALEGLFHSGEFQDSKEKSVVGNYDYIMINLRTLFRNCYYAFEEDRDRLKTEVLFNSVIDDTSMIEKTVKEETKGRMKVLYYICTYEGINKKLPNVKFKDATTPLQIEYNAHEKGVIRRIMDEYVIGVFELEPKLGEATLLITHYPLDLVNARENFPSVALLESHTGKVKQRMLWYTKLNGKNQNIPFCKAMLTIFGDGIMFSPQDLKVRNVIKKTAEKYNWHQATTMARILANLKLANEPHVAEFLRKMS